MTTESETKLARYKTIEKEADAWGRVIGVRRLKPSEKTKLTGMTTDLTGSEEVIGPNGEKILVPHRLELSIAATVCVIDESPIPFPRNRGELEAIQDRLDDEGIRAAGLALIRLNNGVVDAPVEEAKN